MSFRRWRHLPDCQEHHQKKRNDEQYQEKCDCEVYNAPSLTYSKIGLALHMEFIEDDGSKINLDVDINPPTLPVGLNRKCQYSRFSGSHCIKHERHKITKILKQ